mgnify:CR=1 FL=1
MLRVAKLAGAESSLVHNLVGDVTQHGCLLGCLCNFLRILVELVICRITHVLLECGDRLFVLATRVSIAGVLADDKTAVLG